MAVFSATLNQTALMFLFIAAGYILAKGKFIPDNAHTVLSKLESTLLIPALVMGTFINNFTAEKLASAGVLLLQSILLLAITTALTLFCVRFCSKDPYARNLYTYGLCFSNFSFVGNAVINALYPDIFMEYLLFTLPLWTLIYLWGVPVLLMGGEGKQTLAQRAKSFIGMLLGMLIGLTKFPVPQFFGSAVTALGHCMSPVAMLLTGMTIAHYDLRDILKLKSVYWVTFLRLVVYPLLFLVALYLVPMPKTFAICALCALAMPLGLSTIIIPSALGKDTRVAASMALVSHILACITIPVLFMLFDYLFK